MGYRASVLKIVPLNPVVNPGERVVWQVTVRLDEATWGSASIIAFLHVNGVFTNNTTLQGTTVVGGGYTLPCEYDAPKTPGVYNYCFIGAASDGMRWIYNPPGKCATLTVRAPEPKCQFAMSIEPSQAKAGELVTITTTLYNIGDGAGNLRAITTIAGVNYVFGPVWVSAGSYKNVSKTISMPNKNVDTPIHGQYQKTDLTWVTSYTDVVEITLEVPTPRTAVLTGKVAAGSPAPDMTLTILEATAPFPITLKGPTPFPSVPKGESRSIQYMDSRPGTHTVYGTMVLKNPLAPEGKHYSSDPVSYTV